MPYLKVDNVAIRGISACVPPKVEENISLPIYATREEAEKVIATTGVERKHIVSDGITASDLCLQAAQRIMAQGGLSVADGCRCLTKELDMIAC